MISSKRLNKNPSSTLGFFFALDPQSERFTLSFTINNKQPRCFAAKHLN
ncbi:hypothetical protein sync_2751 [Synechococcus sp. CC9311]|nr:hypothetical protein sync_2751 [Synechococcus sp. CC9311]